MAQGDNATIAGTIKVDVAQFIARINVHDAQRATAFDATDIVSMECGRPSTTTLATERSGSQVRVLPGALFLQNSPIFDSMKIEAKANRTK